MSDRLTILEGHVLETLKQVPDGTVNTCVTSPPYWGLRDYGHADQIGLERTPEEYTAKIVEVFQEVRRVLRDDGTVWLNLGDSYAGGGRGGNPDESPFRKQATNAGSVTGVTKNPWPIPTGLKPKDLVGIPWMVAIALRIDGWYLRCDIIWHKPNPMPESVTDRPTKSHEYIFLLSKSAQYYYDANAIKEPYHEESFARYQYAFGGSKSEHLLATDQVHTRPIGMREYKGQATKDYGAAGAQDPSDTKRRVLESMANGEGRNKRSVWTVTTSPFRGAHFATFPPRLITPCILAGCPVGGVVLDPFAGSFTTALVSLQLNRRAIACELNHEYIEIGRNRCAGELMQDKLL